MNIDYSQWPIVKIKYKEIVLNNEIFEDYKVKFLTILKKCKDLNQKCLLIVDLLDMKKVPLKYMNKQRIFHNKINDYTIKYIQSIFIILKSVAVRNILKVFVNMSKKKQTFYFLKDLNEAYNIIENKFLIENNVLKNNISDNNINENKYSEQII